MIGLPARVHSPHQSYLGSSSGMDGPVTTATVVPCD